MIDIEQKKKELMKGLNLQPNLESFFNELCEKYIIAREENANYIEWLKYVVIFYSASKEELKGWPIGYWKNGLFQIMQDYFKEALENGGPNLNDCKNYIGRNLDPW